MKLDERRNRIGALLRDHILPRYKRPEHLDDVSARAELADLVNDLNASWPLMSPDQFDEIGRLLAKELRTTYTHRTWPPIAIMLKAQKTALASAFGPHGRSDDHPFDPLDARRMQLEKWCRGEAPCGGHLITRANLEALAMDGTISRDQIEHMLTFASNNLGIIREQPGGDKRKTDGVTIALKRIPN